MDEPIEEVQSEEVSLDQEMYIVLHRYSKNDKWYYWGGYDSVVDAKNSSVPESSEKKIVKIIIKNEQ